MELLQLNDQQENLKWEVQRRGGGVHVVKDEGNR